MRITVGQVIALIQAGTALYDSVRSGQTIVAGPDGSTLTVTEADQHFAAAGLVVRDVATDAAARIDARHGGG